MKYIKSTYPDYGNDENKKLIHFSEVNIIDKGENRRVIVYPNGKIKLANVNSGYDGEEISHGYVYENDLLLELNNFPEIVTIQIQKEEFEIEWQKAISQPGFKLEPYPEEEWIELE